MSCRVSPSSVDDDDIRTWYHLHSVVRMVAVVAPLVLLNNSSMFSLYFLYISLAFIVDEDCCCSCVPV